jgi:hypothetical protein
MNMNGTNNAIQMKRIILLLLTVCFFSNNLMADSPLTSIEFWKASEDLYVLKIGKEPGKKKMDKRMFNYLMSSNVTVFDKLALINALGWEFNSDVRNSEIFLDKLKKSGFELIKKSLIKDSGTYYFDDECCWESINSLKDDFQTWSPSRIINAYSSFAVGRSNDIYILYLYLLAMDDYLDVSVVYDELHNIQYDFDSEIDPMIDLTTQESFEFIKMLVSSQHILITKGIQCDVWEEYSNYNQGCVSNIFIKKALPICYEYLRNYSSNCDLVDYNIAGYCNGNVIHANQNQKVFIVNYPVFVYGQLTVYNQNNSEVFKSIIDGDDGVILDISNYPIGSYRIQMINTQTEPKTPYNLELIIY